MPHDTVPAEGTGSCDTYFQFGVDTLSLNHGRSGRVATPLPRVQRCLMVGSPEWRFGVCGWFEGLSPHAMPSKQAAHGTAIQDCRDAHLYHCVTIATCR
jgi:hypothetical protein